MEELFLCLLNRSLTAGWMVLAIVLLRWIFRKRIPGTIFVVLWGLVAVRLLLPVSWDSAWSLIPSAEPVPRDIAQAAEPALNTGIPFLNAAINPVLSDQMSPDVAASINPLQVVMWVAAMLWLAGCAGMMIYAVVGCARIRRRVREAVPAGDGIWICDRISTPFVFGMFRPRIFLPSLLDEKTSVYVMAHERAHLERRDPLWKPIGFLLLSIFWFQPLLWVAYSLFCRDIERACDEKVLRSLGEEGKVPYSRALLECSAPRRTVGVCPLAFGETGVRARVKNVLNYKKPTFWVIVIAVILVLAAGICFLTNPKTDPPAEQSDNVVYSYGDIDGVSKSVLMLDRKEGKFAYVASLFMSHADVGAFTEDEKTVVCRTSEVCYTFRKQGDRLIYDAKESTPMGSCRMEEEWIPDGTVFLLDPHFGAAGDK